MITWLSRYSDTMEDDKQGRWARVAYAGKTDKMTIDGKICYWEIAWISKLRNDNKTQFLVSYKFPSHEKNVFEDLDYAKMEVESSFKWFLKCVK